jgi:(2Fe-2S) ferredoxin
METEKTPFNCHVFVCVNERPGGERASCAASGGEALALKLKAESKRFGLDDRGVRVSQSRCLGCCESGPVVMIYPQGIQFSRVSEGDIGRIIDVVCDHLPPV